MDEGTVRRGSLTSLDNGGMTLFWDRTSTGDSSMPSFVNTLAFIASISIPTRGVKGPSELTVELVVTKELCRSATEVCRCGNSGGSSGAWGRLDGVSGLDRTIA